MADVEQNQTDTTPQKSFMPHIILGVAAIVILLLAYLFLGGEEKSSEPEPVVIEEQIVTEPDPEPIAPEPEYEEPTQLVTPEPTPPPEPEPEPEPLDLSDGAIKTAVMGISAMPELAQLLVDEDLIRRFVVFTNNLAEEQLADSHHLLRAPESKFKVYRQADKEWIDSASYQRYTVYAEILDSMDTETMMTLYETYKPAISNIFVEIGDPSEDFDSRLIDAIDHLLDTPEVPVPVEVYTDSVMYKYRIERVEDLSGPQKQLLRTGPENMRLIKAKMRELRDALLAED
ncbi:MAG: DUF3014 domain-containing protein [Aestuariibacter sp.]